MRNPFFARFDSASIFGALLGTEEIGLWLLAPNGPGAVVVERRSEDSAFVLATTWETFNGEIQITDFMPIGKAAHHWYGGLRV